MLKGIPSSGPSSA